MRSRGEIAARAQRDVEAAQGAPPIPAKERRAKKNKPARKPKAEVVLLDKVEGDLAAIGAEIDAAILEACDDIKAAAYRWRCKLGAALLRARALIPTRGPDAKQWHEFLSKRNVLSRTASNWMRLARYAEEHPEQAAAFETTDAAYLAMGIKRERSLAETSCAEEGTEGGTSSRKASTGRIPIDPAGPAAPPLPDKPFQPVLFSDGAPTDEDAAADLGVALTPDLQAFGAAFEALAQTQPTPLRSDPSAAPSPAGGELPGGLAGLMAEPNIPPVPRAAAPALDETATLRRDLAAAQQRAEAAEAKVAEMTEEIHGLRNNLHIVSLQKDALESGVALREREAEKKGHEQGAAEALAWVADAVGIAKVETAPDAIRKQIEDRVIDLLAAYEETADAPAVRDQEVPVVRVQDPQVEVLRPDVVAPRDGVSGMDQGDVVAPPELVVERDPDASEPTGEESQERRRPAKKGTKDKPQKNAGRTWHPGDQAVVQQKGKPRRAVVCIAKPGGSVGLYLRRLGKLQPDHVSVPADGLKDDPAMTGRQQGIAEALDYFDSLDHAPADWVESLRKAKGA